VANSSVYDGASAVGEAVLMAQRLTRRERVVLAGSIHPQWREVVRSYVAARGVDIGTSQISLEPDGLREQRVLDLVDEHTACVVVSSPISSATYAISMACPKRFANAARCS